MNGQDPEQKRDEKRCLQDEKGRICDSSIPTGRNPASKATEDPPESSRSYSMNDSCMFMNQNLKPTTKTFSVLKNQNDE